MLSSICHLLHTIITHLLVPSVRVLVSPMLMLRWRGVMTPTTVLLRLLRYLSQTGGLELIVFFNSINCSYRSVGWVIGTTFSEYVVPKVSEEG